MAATGLRISELVWLEWKDLDLDKGILRVRAKPAWTPKNGDERAVPLSGQAKAIVAGLRRAAPWVFTDPRGPGRQGRQISDRQALKELKRAMAKADVEEGNLHALRRTFITQMSNRGVPAPMLAGWVGHSDLNMILRYYRQDEAEGVRMMARIETTVGAV
ncbi:MAG: site-specific integrase [Dehalococcoidia bacterium]|nr:site-specific integrase [Planctomycetota bacterium]MCK6564924.1 site-specific integrase [Dehalococcoidia bacterium]